MYALEAAEQFMRGKKSAYVTPWEAERRAVDQRAARSLLRSNLVASAFGCAGWKALRALLVPS